MKNIIEDFNKLIDKGIKIHQIDEKSQKIGIIEGVEITKEKTDVLVSLCKIDFDDKFRTFFKSEKFQNACFKPKKRGIILIDIAGYSKGDTLYQAAVLSVFNQVINSAITSLKLFSKGKLVEQIIPTGDGCYIVFDENLNERFFRSVLMINAEMHVLQNRILNKFGKDINICDKLNIRIGCTLNETDFFIDVAGNRNCYGVGMNEASRVLSYGQKEAEAKYKEETYNTVFFDETVYNQAKPLIDWLKVVEPKIDLIELGDVADKHSLTRKIWWVKNLPKHLAINFFSPNELIDE